ncbi:thiamine phosphate synthase [Paenibacillus jilunlii]|uniref:Thiamine-phosphate synthase n=1 Tax=Paenibacillus jilunlii TaxID=682956 RepID=A0A1G9H5P6_9BACL|nr:thiamine phosphate synthase [Paenibacillus jilunlii]KWX77408.1 thiamine-phosphate pyrophosphorylase [Paenibacillus jilunlii]SDL08308.1 thiamine-phosphate diphosphorylase [Paenibacillus jilunlii]
MQRMDSEHVRRLLKLYFIMGSVNCKRTPLETLAEAMDGGITLFQYREKGSAAFSGQAYVELAQQLQQKCRERKIPFIVNDDIELAVALDADGVHMGQNDAPARSLRERMGAHKIIGVSAHNLKEAQQAIADGADYLGVGPVYPTSSKDDAEAVQGTGVIEELRRSGLTIPLVGIGGITVDNARPVIQAGADGISVISAIAGAADIREAARNFLRVIQQ